MSVAAVLDQRERQSDYGAKHMKTRISYGALALGIVSGGASAGPLADILNQVTGGGGLTDLILNGSDPIPGYNDSPFADFTGQLDGSSALIDAAVFEPTDRGNGGLIGAGIGNESNTGNGALLGLGALSGDDSGNGALGISALSSGGGNSGQGEILGVELLNGDTVLGLNSGAAGQSADIIPNPAGVSGSQLGDAIRPAAQDALQRGGAVSGPLEEGVLVGLDAIVEPLGSALQPVTDAISPVLGNGLGSDGGGSSPLPGLPEPIADGLAPVTDAIGGLPGGSIVAATFTGDSSQGGNDVNAGIIGGDSSGNGDVVGAGVFGGEGSGGSGVASVAAISGSNSSESGDVNAGVANQGANKGGLLGVGVANGNSSGQPPVAPPKPPVNPVPSNPVTNAENNCESEAGDQIEGLKGAGDLSQFKRSKDTCDQKKNDQVAEITE